MHLFPSSSRIFEKLNLLFCANGRLAQSARISAESPTARLKLRAKRVLLGINRRSDSLLGVRGANRCY